MKQLALNTETLTTMSSREIADLTGKEIGNVHRDIRTMLDALKDDPVLDHQQDDSILNHVREDKDARGYTTAFYLNKELTLTLVAGYDAKLRLAIIKRWQELETKAALPSLTQAEQDIRIAVLLADALNVAPSGRVVMLGVALKHSAPHMLPALPGYTVDAPRDVVVANGSAMPTASATDLLKRHNVKMSTAKFNELLENHRLLHRSERITSRGDYKGFWSVTVEGEEYGKNLVSAQNTRETQPHWYVERFGALLKAVGVGE